MDNIVIYNTFNYPTPDQFMKSLEILHHLGVPTIEIGLPVTNPFLDGPVIQETHRIVAEKHYSANDLILMLKEIRQRFSFKIVLMTYNEGVSQFDLAHLPTELYDGILYIDRALDSTEKLVQLYHVGLTNEEIQSRLAKNQVFCYVQSIQGKTGGQASLGHDLKALISQLKSMTTLPVFIGFGIKNKENYDAARNIGADGVIIGTRFIEVLNQGNPDAVETFINQFDS